MSIILLGWELGGNYGHANQLISLSTKLREAGHTVYIALQRVDALRLLLEPPEYLLQAPIWPNCLKDVTQSSSAKQPMNYGDFFAQFCLDKDWALTSMIKSWDTLLCHIQPDLVVADVAPALLLAAKGRIPTIRIGSGYDVPPATMKEFPSFSGLPSAEDHQRALERINAALETCERDLIDSYPEVLKSNLDIVASYPEFDPYSHWRKTSYYLPVASEQIPEIVDESHDEVFLYYHAVTKQASPIWRALAETKLPIRLHIPDTTADHSGAFEELGFQFERNAVPIERILRRSKLIISHGGLGTSIMALLCGLPHLVIYHDTEKGTNGESIAKLGVGDRLNLFSVTADILREKIVSMHSDVRLRSHCKNVARSFRRREMPSASDRLLAAADEFR